jgi:hypothetical protein
MITFVANGFIVQGAFVGHCSYRCDGHPRTNGNTDLCSIFNVALSKKDVSDWDRLYKESHFTRCKECMDFERSYREGNK